MKTEIKLIREISYAEGDTYIEGVPPQKIEITIDGDTELYDLLALLNDFIRGMGYHPPTNHTLDYVNNDAEIKNEECRCHTCEGDTEHP